MYKSRLYTGIEVCRDGRNMSGAGTAVEGEKQAFNQEKSDFLATSPAGHMTYTDFFLVRVHLILQFCATLFGARTLCVDPLARLPPECTVAFLWRLRVTYFHLHT